MRKTHAQKGYIALITVILVSASLLVAVTGAGFAGFHSRFSILESTQKEQSLYLAESCFHTAILQIIQKSTYLLNATVTIPVGKNVCSIIAVSNGSLFASNRIIKVQGQMGNTFTNLIIEIDPSALPEVEILSWHEVGRF